MSDKHFDKFWAAIRKCNNSKSSVNADVINGHTGDTAISEMWKNHYQALYNSVQDNGAKKEFLDRLSQLDKYSNTYVINVQDISMYCNKQKKGKAVGPDGIPMEALVYGGTRLHIHLALLFNCFIKTGYVPRSFMQSLIIPLIKSKSADFTDVKNYIAIAVSTAASKLFECIVAEEYHSTSPEDMYQSVWF